MAVDEHLSILKKGVTAWNNWRALNPNIRPDLTNANLKDANLTRAFLMVTNLTRADLRGADLTNATLTGAKFTRADLTDASLTGADLSHANHLTQEQLDSACIRKGGGPPALREGLKPPQKVCGPQTR